MTSGLRRAAKIMTNYFSLHQPIRTRLTSNLILDNGFSNVARRPSKASTSFGNFGGAVSVRCEVSGVGSETDDNYYMRRAVKLAGSAIGFTSPNPMVGCVIVKDGKVVGEGFHPKAGQPHAEVFALRDAGDLAENATAYVSLEPCNHHGRTPPCTEAFIKAKLKKVVVGMVDPNPIVASKGVDRLRDAGIEVIVGVEEDLCKKLLEAYSHKMLTGKPFVTLRYSMSINGSLLDQLGEGATEPGGYYSQLIQEYDAVVQSSMNLAKDFSFPSSKEPKANQPLHVLVAKNPNSPILMPNSATDETAKVLIFSEKELAVKPETTKNSVETILVDQISLDTILNYCSKEGSSSVLLDLRGDFNGLEEILLNGFKKKLVQKLVVEVLPLWAGGEASISSTLMSQMQRLGLGNMSARTVGRSVLLEGYF